MDIKRFSRWMKDQRAWDEYKYNAKMVNKNPRRIVDIERDCEPEEFLTSAFVWELTEEGHEFWSKLNMEWHNYMKYGG